MTTQAGSTAPPPKPFPRTLVAPAQVAGRAARSRARGSVVVAVVLALVFGIAGCTTDAAGQNSQTGSGDGYVSSEQQVTVIEEAKRTAAPTVSGESVQGSRQISSDDYSGQVIVINVWGSWCPPCRDEAPDLQAAKEQTEGTAQFIGIDSRDPGKGAPRAFLRAFDIDYPNIYDPDGSQVVKFTQVPPSAIPSTLIIDEEGRVAVRILGTISEQTLVDMIDDVATGK